MELRTGSSSEKHGQVLTLHLVPFHGTRVHHLRLVHTGKFMSIDDWVLTTVVLATESLCRTRTYTMHSGRTSTIPLPRYFNCVRYLAHGVCHRGALWNGVFLGAHLTCQAFLPSSITLAG